MPPTNGLDRDAENTERLISLVARLNDALRDFSEEQRRSSERLGRLESAVEKAREKLAEIGHHLAEARDDLEKVREDTNPHGFRLLDPARYPLGGKKDDSGKVLAVSDGKVRFALPSTWVGVVLKASMSAGGGAALLRVIQWLTTGH